MKRILIFSLAYYPNFVGGAEVSIKEITDRILPADIEFHMVTLRYDSASPPIEKIGNVTVHRIGFTKPNPNMSDLKKFPLHWNKVFFQFSAAKKALSLHRQYHFDAIWAMMAHACGVPAAIFKLFHPRTPYILTLQEGDPPQYIERTLRPLWPLFTRAFTKADVVQAISTFLGAWAKRRGFNGPLEIITNGVNTKLFSHEYPKTELTELEQKLGKKANDIYIVTTSRLVHKNAVDDCIRALKELPANIQFLVLGIGPDEMLLKKIAETCGVSERVQFLGRIDHADMPKYLKISNIFVRPSRSEGMGNSFIEAFAAGIPVIATQEGGLADFLFDAKRNPDKTPTGWAVDVDSPAQIAKAIQEVLGNPEQAKRVVENARKVAFERYDWDSIAAHMRERVFGRVLK